jgi:hypothetical protein
MKIWRQHSFPRNGNNEGFAAMGMDVRRSLSKEIDIAFIIHDPIISNRSY